MPSVSRILRVALAFVAAVVVLFVAAFGALVYWLDAESVQAKLSAYSEEALGARVEFAQPLKVTHLTTLVVDVPAATFFDIESGEKIGSIRSASADISLWSLMLGAVQVKSATVDGAVLRLTVPEANGEALFETTFGAVKFPADLRINTFSLTSSDIELVTGKDEGARTWELSEVTFSSGRLSPEMTTPFEFSARVASSGTTPAAAKEPVAEAPADPAAEPAQEPAPQAPAAAEDSSETPEPAPAEPAEETSSNTQPEATPQYRDEPQQEVQQTSSEEPSSPVETQNTAVPEQAADEEAAPAQTPEQPAIEPVSEPAAEPAQEPKEQAPAPAESAALHYFIRSAHAAELPFGADVFHKLEAESFSGALSAKGTLTVSTTDRVVMVEDVSFAAEAQQGDLQITAVAKADRVRFKGSEVMGVHLTAAVSQPNRDSGDIHLGAADFRLRPGIFESPEMRISYTDQTGSRVSTFEASSAVKADFTASRARFESLSALVSISGDPNLPGDFNAAVSGEAHADLSAKSAEVSLSGNFAGASISFNGTVTDFEHPQLAGELMMGEVNRDALPGADTLAWMKHFDFEGTLRIGRISAGSLSGTQLNGVLSINDGAAQVKGLVINTSEGRVFGDFNLAGDSSWLLKGRADGVSLEKFTAGLGAAPQVAGSANGDFTLSGKGFDPQGLTGTAQLRVLRPVYTGVDAASVRSHVAGAVEAAAATRQGAKTAFDEATCEVTVNGNMVKIDKIVARSVYVRVNAQATLDIAAGSIAGTANAVFAPQQGLPSIHVAADIAGASASPAWTFDYETSGAALRRAQGKPTAPSVDKPKEEKSLWQSVKDFFRF